MNRPTVLFPFQRLTCILLLMLGIPPLHAQFPPPIPDFNPPLPDFNPPLPDFNPPLPDPFPPPPETEFLRGDINADGIVDIGDLGALVDIAYFGGAVPGCTATADINGDGVVNPLLANSFDPIFVPPPPDTPHLFNWLLGGNPPAPPFPEVGIDPGATDLTCDVYSITPPPPANPSCRYEWTSVSGERGDKGITSHLLVTAPEPISGFSLVYRYDIRQLQEIRFDFKDTIVAAEDQDAILARAAVFDSAEPERYKLIVLVVLFVTARQDDLFSAPIVEPAEVPATTRAIHRQPLVRMIADIPDNARRGVQVSMRPAEAEDFNFGGATNSFLTTDGVSKEPGTQEAQFAYVGGGGGEFLFLRGDFDNNGAREITDAVASFEHLFLRERPGFCFDQADSNADSGFDISDGISTLEFLFNGGMEPSWDQEWRCLQGDFVFNIRATVGRCGGDGGFACTFEPESTTVIISD